MKSLVEKILWFAKHKFAFMLLLIIFLLSISLGCSLSEITNQYFEHAFLCFLLSAIFYIDFKKGRGLFSRITFWNAFGTDDPNEKYKQFCFTITCITTLLGIINLLFAGCNLFI